MDINKKAKEINILLLSDLHFKEFKDIDDFCNAIIDELKKEGNQPDIILLAGDLADRENPYKGYKTLVNFIEKIQKAFNKNFKIPVFYTPGNHDILQKPKIKGKETYNYQHLTNLLQKNKFYKFHNTYTKDNHVDHIYSFLKSLEDSESTFEKKIKKYEDILFEKYKECIATLCTEYNKNIEFNKICNLETIYTSSVLGIDITSVNGSWFCGYSNSREKEKLFLINYLIKKLKKEYDAKNEKVQNKNINIGLMHQPYTWLNSSEYNDVEKNENQSFTLFSEITDIICFGHEHGDMKEPHTFNNKTKLIVNGCSYTEDKIKNPNDWPLTFGIIKLNKIARYFNYSRYQKEKDKYQLLNNNNKTIKYPLSTNNNVAIDYEEELHYQKYCIVKFLKNNTIDYTQAIILEQQLNESSIKGLDKCKGIFSQNVNFDLSLYIIKYNDEPVEEIEARIKGLNDINKKIYLYVELGEIINKNDFFKKFQYKKIQEKIAILNNNALLSNYTVSTTILIW